MSLLSYVAQHERTRRSALVLIAFALAVPPLVFVASPVDAARVNVTVVDAPNAGPNAKIRVSKTNGLRNETVEVSWSGFRPSSATQLNNAGSSYDTETQNPVRVYQCRGDSAANPSSSTDCYGSGGFRGIPAIGGNPAVPAVPGFSYPGQTDEYANTPDGPSNFQDTVTAPDGTGRVTIQLFTRTESPSLGCDESTPCSLVVVPNYGRPNGATEDQLDAPWAWDRRTVVPLNFAQIEVACPLGSRGLPVEGSPMSARLLASWRGGACNDADTKVSIDYTMVGEEQARNDVMSGIADFGLATQVPAKDATSGSNVVTAPISISGIAIAFQVDDVNGQPIRHMNLNARLVAKLITASYRVADDPNVEGNPSNLFADPEFRALNPGMAWPSGSPGNHVLLLGDMSDMTWALTRWIDADKEARAFLDGKPDPFGTHVNKAYKGLDLPFTTFPLLDEVQSDLFEPIQGLDHVSRQLSLAQFPGAIVTFEDGLPVISKPPRQNPGRREIIGIIDAADAASFRLDVASLQVAHKTFVAPNNESFRASLRTVDEQGGVVRHRRQADAGYPLTMVTSALARVDASATTREAAARFLEFAATRGQRPGTAVGDLPEGHLPMPDSMRKQAQQAARLLRLGVVPGSPNGPDGPGGPNGSPTSSLGGDVPGGAIDPDGADGGDPEGQPLAGDEQAVAYSTAEPLINRILLPALLIAGVIALVVGVVVSLLSSRGKGPAWLRM